MADFSRRQAISAIGASAFTVTACATTESFSRIEQIEQNLTRFVHVRGRPIVRRTLAEWMISDHVPAVSIAVVENGRLSWAKAYGSADLDTRMIATTETLFHAGSISKPVAASAVMQLVEQGAVRLDDPVNDHLTAWHVPENAFTRRTPVTIRHLLTHTSGLSIHGFEGYDHGKPLPSTLQILNGEAPANNAAVVVEAEPGSAWRYSGGGFVVLQLLLEEKTGAPFDSLMRKRVLGPLHMGRSTYGQPLDDRLRRSAATGYFPDGRPLSEKIQDKPYMAAGGLVTTPTDLSRWIIAVQAALAGRPNPLMPPGTARQMLTPALGDWGLGVAVLGEGAARRFAHSGNNFGFHANFAGYVDGSGGLVVMVNGENGASLMNALMRAIAAEYGWKGLDRGWRSLEPLVLEDVRLSKDELADVAGSYGAGSFPFRVEDGVLRLRRLELIPQGRNRFLANNDEADQITFTRTELGKVSGFDLNGEFIARDP